MHRSLAVRLAVREDGGIESIDANGPRFRVSAPASVEPLTFTRRETIPLHGSGAGSRTTLVLHLRRRR